MFYQACRRECSQNDIKKRVHASLGRCKGGAVKLLRGGDPRGIRGGSTGDPRGIQYVFRGSEFLGRVNVSCL